MTRKLTVEEINDILDFITPSKSIPLDCAKSIVNSHKNRLRKQLKKQKVYPEIIPELKKMIKNSYFSSLIDPGESVGIIAAQSIGQKNTQSTLNSVDWNDKILYNNNGKIVVKPIGEMIDTLLENAEEKDIQLIPENRTQYLPLPDGYSIPSCDENGYNKWYKIEAVTKHLPVGKLVKVITQSGREVTATQSKSFLVWNGEKFDSVNGSNVKVGDFLPTTHTLPKPDKQLDFFLYTDTSNVTSKIQLYEEFGFLVGIYLANGLVTSSCICISNNDEKIRKRITDYFDKFGVTHRLVTQEGKSSVLRIHFVLFARIFKIICGTGSTNKRVPDFAYNANDDFIKGLIDGYFSGADSVYKDGSVIVSSESKQIIEGVSFLLSYYSIFGSLDKTKKNNIKTSYILEITNGFAKKFANTFTLTEDRKQERLQEITYEIGRCQEKFPLRDVYFDQVISVEFVNGSTEYVYDLTVEETRNFTLFNGLNVVDTFHRAGQAESQVLTGVPRFQELLNTTKVPKGPSCKIFLKDKTDILEEAKDIIGSNVVSLTVNDISKEIDIELNKKPEHWYKSFQILYEDEEWYRDFTEYSDCLNIKLDMDKLYRYKLSLEKIVSNIHENFEDACCVFSPENIGQLDVYFDVSSINLDREKLLFITDENCVQIYLEETVEPVLKKTRIAGIESINNIYFYKEGDQWVVDTDGSNFLNILLLPFVDRINTVSNNIWEIYEILGIEAIKQYLTEEFHDILGISSCHISVLVNRMTFSGTISSISRYTMRKEKIGTISKSSFEETVDQFVRAASNGETDDCEAVSSSIVCGNRPNFGTGMVDLKVDMDMLINNKLS